MKLPGFLNPLGLKLAGAALLLVGFLSFAGGNQIFSPGALSEGRQTGTTLGGITAHADLSESCSTCHATPGSGKTMNDQCLDCHTDVQAELKDANSLHGILTATACRDCHTEHRGPQGYLTVMERREIDHNQFGFSLAAHQTLSDGSPFTCTACHTQRLTRFEPERCESCHRTDDERFTQAHIRDFGSNCRACHEGTDIFSKANFDHNRLEFPLLGKHAGIRCLECHQGVTSYAGFRDAPTECADCHRQNNPHPQNFGLDCARCHNTEGWPTEIFDHDLAAFKLTGQHQQVACSQCHVDSVFRGTPTTCVACHVQDDVHRGWFGSDCALCHTPESWQRGPFEHTFPLDHGGLGQIACVTCHTIPDNYQAYTCSNCHDPDDVRRQHFFAQMMGANISDCARCHDRGQKTMQMH